ncbi:hypothetical protein GCM10027080_07950 [Pedococcus soli]
MADRRELRTVRLMTTISPIPESPSASATTHPCNRGAVIAVARAARCGGICGEDPPSHPGCGWECVELWAAAVTEVRLAALSALPEDCAPLV